MSNEICPYMKARLIMLRGGLDEETVTYCTLLDRFCNEDPENCEIRKYDEEMEVTSGINETNP